MSGASGGPDTPKTNINNAPDLLRAMPVKVPLKDGVRKGSCIISLSHFNPSFTQGIIYYWNERQRPLETATRVE